MMDQQEETGSLGPKGTLAFIILTLLFIGDCGKMMHDKLVEIQEQEISAKHYMKQIEPPSSPQTQMIENKFWKPYKDCYNNGTDLSVYFDLIEDYNLSCDRIGYINDHLIKNHEKMDAGHLKGSYLGFLSDRHVRGQYYQWVTNENLATGRLVKNLTYHLDCNNETHHWYTGTVCVSGKKNPMETPSCLVKSEGKQDTRRYKYYDEKDFVLYYVERCLE